MSKIKVIDNFLSKKEHKEIKNFLLGYGDFAWFICNEVTGVPKNDKVAPPYMFHLFIKDGLNNSDAVFNLKNIFDKLGVSQFLRVKANLYPKNTEIIEHGFHKDYDYKNKAMIYHVNTSNGYTKIKDKKVDSIENRAVFFEGSDLHTSTTCTDSNFRCNISFNW